jgi:hypothetical protein
MPSSSKAKGSRIEREIVKRHLEADVPAKKIPLSGAVEGFKGDVMIDGRFRGEVKARKTGSGFKTLEGWLGDNDLLFLRRDRAKPIVVMEWETYIKLMRKECVQS